MKSPLSMRVELGPIIASGVFLSRVFLPRVVLLGVVLSVPLLSGMLLSVPLLSGPLLSGIAEAQFVEPVDAPVVDRYRPPAHIGGPGNRGWEYAVRPGSGVRAASDGVVVFAGTIAGRFYVSINHVGGIRTTYSYLSGVSVSRGQRITSGSVIGTTGETFHFGVRRGRAYMDPALLFGGSVSSRPRLVVRPGRVPSRTPSRPTVPVLYRHR